MSQSGFEMFSNVAGMVIVIAVPRVRTKKKKE